MKNEVVSITAILALTAIEIVAQFLKTDGTFFSLIIVAIGAIAGVTVVTQKTNKQ